MAGYALARLAELIDKIGFSPLRPSEAYSGDRWVQIRVFRPDRLDPITADAAETKATTDPRGTVLPKGRPGRKPKWDWDRAIRHIIKVANSPDGLPPIQADIERLVADWFFEHYGENPSESMIRTFVRRTCIDVLDQ